MAAAGGQPYMPMKVPLSRDAHLQAMAVSLEAANAVLPSPLCANPMLPLVATACHLQGYAGQPICSTERTRHRLPSWVTTWPNGLLP